jgi:transporter family protein
MHTWFGLSILALVLFGVTGVTQKLSTNRTSFELSYVWFCVAMVAVSAGVAVLVPLDWRIRPSIGALAIGGGLLNGLGVLTSFAALERGGKASVVIPIINLYPLVTIGGAWLFLGERLSAIHLGGVCLALAGVVLLSRETASHGPSQSDPAQDEAY